MGIDHPEPPVGSNRSRVAAEVLENTGLPTYGIGAALRRGDLVIVDTSYLRVLEKVAEVAGHVATTRGWEPECPTEYCGYGAATLARALSDLELIRKGTTN